MANTGMTRPLDELGRIVIPIEMRRNLSIEARDLVAINMEGDRIWLEKCLPADKCVFCGQKAEGLFKGKALCKGCIQQIVETR